MSRKHQPGRTTPSPITVSRRSVLEWFGNATVIALTPELLAACSGGGIGSDGAAPGSGGRPGGTGGSAGGGAGGAGGVTSAGPASFDFAPGSEEHAAYTNWRVRTVDAQTLVDILASWTLTVDGLVEEPRSFTFAELVGLPRQDQLTDFHCVEGWSVYDIPWNGVHLSQLLELTRPIAAATHVTFHSIGGTYRESLPLGVALEPRTLLAYGVGGSTLPLAHGFPLRVVVPRLFGYKSAKFVERVELANQPIEGYWVERGYTYEAEVPASRLRDDRY